MARQKLMDNDSFVKALGLGAALIIGTFMISRVDSLIQLADTIFQDTQEVGTFEGTLFSDEQWKAKQAELAGFWFYESPSFSDRIELKDNGIIWRYSTRRYQFPFGYKNNLDKVSTAYMQPFSQDTTTKVISQNVRVIRETYLANGSDTCSGNVMFDVLWTSEPKPAETTFELNGKTYHKYTGDIHYFFPDSAINLVDDINVNGCIELDYDRLWIRNNIAQSFDGQEIDFSMLTTVHFDMVKNYYTPLCLSDAVTGLSDGDEFDIELNIQLNPTGLVDSVEVISKKLTSKYSRASIAEEVKEWRFPADGKTPMKISYKGLVIKKSLDY